VKIAAYAVSGLLAGLAGVLWASYESTADPQNDGLYFELAAISAVVIGGTSSSEAAAASGAPWWEDSSSPSSMPS
jgi:ribose/xylose/arabinose/galactoside ABC-type transport system permease subunit